MKCLKNLKKSKSSCKEKGCRQWIDYDDDLNCTLIAIRKKNYKPMTLRETGERLGVSFVRIKQIEDELLKKLAKTKFIDK